LVSKPVAAACVVALLGGLAEVVPRAGFAKIFSAPTPLFATKDDKAPDAQPNLEVGEAALETETRVMPGFEAPTGPTKLDDNGPIAESDGQPDLPSISAEEPPVPLFDPTGHTLDSFFASLADSQAKKPGAITRIAHFGDSVIVSDYVSGTLRRELQDTFGDAGHGFVLIANAWPSYFHNDVFRFATSGWKVSRIVGPMASDGLYGLGGVSFSALSGIRARFGTAEKGDYGRHVSRFVVSYLKQPQGGRLEVLVDGKPHSEIDTDGPIKVGAHETIEVPDGEHMLELGVKGREVRAFGVVLERDTPGVVLDALGVQGARIRFLDKEDDAHWASELAWRKPNLLVYEFGANESGDGYAYPMDEYLRTMKLVLEQGKRALPESSCLVVGAMDRARHENGATTSMKIIQLIVAEQRRAAEQVGCAYFDTYNAMGGWGSMPAWVRRGLGQADMTHPTGVGAQRIGHWLYRALMKNYDAYLKNHRASDASKATASAPAAPASTPSVPSPSAGAARTSVSAAVPEVRPSTVQPH
jgi:hypothetical protein